jgi:hypothetical protein
MQKRGKVHSADRKFGIAGAAVAIGGAKSHPLHLHLAPAGLELLVRNLWCCFGEEEPMKKIVLVIAVCAVLTGCSTCRQMCGGWFNKGDRCNVCPPADCPPGVPRAQFMMPGSPQVLPGPIEIAPVN